LNLEPPEFGFQSALTSISQAQTASESTHILYAIKLLGSSLVIP